MVRVARLLRHAYSTAVTAGVRAIPKVELHRHLEGSISPQTVLDEAKRHGVWLPHGGSGELAHPDTCDIDDITPNIQVTSPLEDLMKVLQVFEHLQSVLCDMESFHRIGREAVLNASEEGIRALELRYSPSFCAMGHGHDFAEMHRSILAGIADAQEELGQDRLGVGVVCISVGAMGETEFAKTTDFVLANQDTFVGFDMAGPEMDPRQWASAIQPVRDAGIPITWHASECASVRSAWNAVHAVEALGAVRIGHGIQAIHDADAVSRLRDAGAMLELSVTSNWVTSSVPSIQEHPARELWEQGVQVSANTDDPCLFDIDAHSEWGLWEESLGFSQAELTAISVKSLDRSFLPPEEKERVYARFFADAEGLDLPATLSEAVDDSDALHCAVVHAADK